MTKRSLAVRIGIGWLVSAAAPVRAARLPCAALVPVSYYHGRIGGMTVEKFSVSFDTDLGRAIRKAANADEESVSAWLAEAARGARAGAVVVEPLARAGGKRTAAVRRPATPAGSASSSGAPRKRKVS